MNFTCYQCKWYYPDRPAREELDGPSEGGCFRLPPTVLVVRIANLLVLPPYLDRSCRPLVRSNEPACGEFQYARP